MDKRALVALSLVGTLAAVGFGAIAFLSIDDQPPGVDVERHPFAPEKPSNLTTQNVTKYATEYEQRRLYNDILAANAHSLFEGERVINVCRAVSVSDTGVDGFRVELACAGGIDNRDDADRATGYEYRVSYRINQTATNQVAIERYPYDTRDTLEQRPRLREGSAGEPETDT